MPRVAVVTGVVSAGLIVALVLWLRNGRLETVQRRTPSIMGTETLLKAVVEAGGIAIGRQALDAAESELREVERLMSGWVGTSEISRFNASEENELVPLSAATLEVVAAALAQARLTGGAFDPTCGSLLGLWKSAEEKGREPSPEEMLRAKLSAGYQKIRLRPEGAEKLVRGVRVDLGAIAKGYAVDRAIAVMRRMGVAGGLVQCGGDLRVFGQSEGGGGWRIALERPYPEAEGVLPEFLLLRDRAMSVSGDTERYFTIQGRRRSHIVDPRTGLPVENRPLVAVIGDSAMLTDVWSTSLSVLGPAGLGQLPPGLEALLLGGSKSKPEHAITAGFEGYAAAGKSMLIETYTVHHRSTLWTPGLWPLTR